jgi:tRNA threonylcarbamoyladenosine biosynthesis protein TsaB
MAKIICIESSTEVCSVALTEDGVLIDLIEDRTGQNHSRLLTVFIDEILKKNQWNASDANAIAVSQGPGSYTGLRIGVSAAKGICFALGIPLIAVCPLQAMVAHVVQNIEKEPDFTPNNSLFIPMIDARRMEVYTATFNYQHEPLGNVEAKIIDSESFKDELNTHTCYFFGNGAMKCAETLIHPNTRFIDGIVTSAANMVALADGLFRAGKFVDVAYFEPFYLKDFMATTPKNTVLANLQG